MQLPATHAPFIIELSLEGDRSKAIAVMENQKAVMMESDITCQSHDLFSAWQSDGKLP